MADRNQNVKVLYVVNSLEMGGAEKVVVDLVNGLDPEYFEPAICCIRRSGPCADRIRRLGVEVIEMDHGEGNDPLLPLKLAGRIRSRGIDVVHSHGRPVFYTGAVGARLGGASVVVHTDHGRVAEDFCPSSASIRLRSKLRNQVLRFVARSVSQFVVVSDCLKDSIASDLGVYRANIVTLLNGVDLPGPRSQREDKRRELGLSRGNLVVCSVGRLAKVKNLQLLLEAVPDVIREVPEARFLLAGDGPGRDGLKEFCRQCGLESIVKFLGERDDIPEILAASDLFVLPSDFEATSIALLEAMASGLAAVATNVGGNPSILADQETGILVAPRDPKALSNAIVFLLRDPTLRFRMGNNAVERVRCFFSIEKMVREYERMYLGLFPEHRGFKDGRTFQTTFGRGEQKVV